MSITRKLRKVDGMVRRRRESNNGSSVPFWFLIFSCWMITAALLIGVYLGSQQPALFDEVNRTYEVKDYNFHIVDEEKHEKIRGKWGYTYRNGENIWLNNRLLKPDNFPGQFIETCNHELLHTLGLGRDQHWRIERYQGKIRDPVCEELKKKVSH